MSDRTKEPTTVPVPSGAPVSKSDKSDSTDKAEKPKLGKRPPPPMGAPTPSAPTVTTTSETPRPVPGPAPASRGPRRARLRLTRVDPWSVMKTAFLLSIAFAVVTVVSVAMVWQVLGAAGVWDSINSTVQEAIGGEDVAGFQIEDYLGTSRVL